MPVSRATRLRSSSADRPTGRPKPVPTGFDATGTRSRPPGTRRAAEIRPVRAPNCPEVADAHALIAVERRCAATRDAAATLVSAAARFFRPRNKKIDDYRGRKSPHPPTQHSRGGGPAPAHPARQHRPDDRTRAVRRRSPTRTRHPAALPPTARQDRENRTRVRAIRSAGLRQSRCRSSARPRRRLACWWSRRPRRVTKETRRDHRAAAGPWRLPSPTRHAVRGLGRPPHAPPEV